MKKVFIALAVVATAMGTSAFTNAPKKVALANYYYELSSEGTYTIYGETPPSETGCQDDADYKCVVGFDIDPGVLSFDAEDLGNQPMVTYSSTDDGIRL